MEKIENKLDRLQATADDHSTKIKDLTSAAADLKEDRREKEGEGRDASDKSGSSSSSSSRTSRTQPALFRINKTAINRRSSRSYRTLGFCRTLLYDCAPARRRAGGVAGGRTSCG
ncbi:hypothetical protein INR49_004722 [Caranx melampygus]|nr:hypothetical protein INR49_004722 [Caranx melampygus]